MPQPTLRLLNNQSTLAENCKYTYPQERKPLMKLKVKDLETDNTWKDIVRIHKGYRKDDKDDHIDRGTLCCLTRVGGSSKWVVVHGRETDDNGIRMDLNCRLALDVKKETEYDFTLRKLCWVERLWFPWRASDPIYRYPAQLGLLALIIGTVLGLIGIVIGLIPIWKHW